MTPHDGSVLRCTIVFGGPQTGGALRGGAGATKDTVTGGGGEPFGGGGGGDGALTTTVEATNGWMDGGLHDRFAALLLPFCFRCTTANPHEDTWLHGDPGELLRGDARFLYTVI